MRPATLLLSCATCALLALPGTAEAQLRLSTDLHLGGGSGSGTNISTPPTPDFLSLGATLVGQVYQFSTGRLMAGVALVRQFDGSHSDVGYFQPDGSIGGPWPFFRSISAVGALDLPGRVAGRITGGVGAFRDNSGYETGGLSASADLTVPGRTRVGFLLSGSRTVLPSYRGGSYGMTSVVIGLRFSSR